MYGFFFLKTLKRSVYVQNCNMDLWSSFLLQVQSLWLQRIGMTCIYICCMSTEHLGWTHLCVSVDAHPAFGVHFLQGWKSAVTKFSSISFSHFYFIHLLTSWLTGWLWMCLWGLEDSLWESIISFHRVYSQDWTQVFKVTGWDTPLALLNDSDL